MLIVGEIMAILLYIICDTILFQVIYFQLTLPSGNCYSNFTELFILASEYVGSS